MSGANASRVHTGRPSAPARWANSGAWTDPEPQPLRFTATDRTKERPATLREGDRPSENGELDHEVVHVKLTTLHAHI